MANRAYLLIMNTTLAASAAGSLQFQVDVGTKLKLKDFVFVSTAAFSITGIRDNEGNMYTNASPSNPILSTMIQSGASSNRSFNGFFDELEVDGGKTLYIDLLDTSAAQNVVRMLFRGQRIS